MQFRIKEAAGDCLSPKAWITSLDPDPANDELYHLN